MTQLRWTLFLLISVGVMFWFNYQESKRVAAARERAAKARKEIDEAKAKAKKTLDEKKPQAELKPDPNAKPEEKKDPPKPEPKPQPEIVIPLGKDEDFGDYRMLMSISTKGAVVKRVELLKDNDKILRNRFVLFDSATAFRVDIPEESLGTKDWELVAEESKPPEQLTFRTTNRDGTLEIKKRFALRPHQYLADFELSFRNLTDKPIESLTYEIEGPYNLPIEGAWYTQYFRRAVTLMVPTNGSFPYLDEQYSNTIAATGKGEVRDAIPIQYSGVAVQYFASTIGQATNPLENRYIQSALPIKYPDLPEEALRRDSQFTNVGVKLTSTPIKIDAKETLKHEYLLFNGPKKRDLLAMSPYVDENLDKLIVYIGFMGMRFDSFSNFMVWFLSWLAKFTGDYGLAIVLMTVVVRICLFPLSFKQTVTMQRMSEKMQILQPKMQELRERYANDPQRMNSELMDLYRKHDYNPMSMFGGCLLLFLQMPIFIALYQALQGSFELRQQPFRFTWIDDLSAPDQLFAFGADIPLLGPYFNLLPILSLIQMLLQMWLMTPPPATPEMAEQQKMQKKMMLIMMVMIGFMFYRVAAGLCIYIITSTSWALLERQFLPKPKHVQQPVATAAPATNGATKPSESTWKTPIEKKRKK